MSVRRPSRRAVTAAIVLGSVRAATGSAMLVGAEPVLTAVGEDPGTRVPRVVVGVLGARHLVQAGLTAGAPGVVGTRTGIVVDLAHAASMVAFAALDRRHGRAALTSAVDATGFALAGLVVTGG